MNLKKLNVQSHFSVTLHAIDKTQMWKSAQQMSEFLLPRATEMKLKVI